MNKDSNERLIRLLQAEPGKQEAIDAILDGRMDRVQQNATGGPLLMSMKAAAEHLGVSRPTLWRICKAQRLRRIEILPGSYRLQRADIEAFAAGKGGACE